MRTDGDRRISKFQLLRSYDHYKRDSPDHSRRVTTRSTFRSGRKNTGLSTDDDNSMQRRGGGKNTLVHDDYGRASQLEVWQVARAATAARFYFEPLKIRNAGYGRGFTEFTDGGFSSANNPTRVGTLEIEKLQGPDAIGIVVSVGTARKSKQDAKKATFFSIIPDSAREWAAEVTDPEKIHEDMEREYTKDHEFPYYRLNYPGGLKTELDEWEPKSKMDKRKESGANTIRDIENAFNNWAKEPENVSQLQKCASDLVTCRRGRMDTNKWERYAIGSQYVCPVRGCDPGDFFERGLFTKHLENKTLKDHGFEGEDLKGKLDRGWKHWRYQAASTPKAS